MVLASIPRFDTTLALAPAQAKQNVIDYIRTVHGDVDLWTSQTRAMLLEMADSPAGTHVEGRRCC